MMWPRKGPNIFLLSGTFGSPKSYLVSAEPRFEWKWKSPVWGATLYFHLREWGEPSDGRWTKDHTMGLDVWENLTQTTLNLIYWSWEGTGVGGKGNAEPTTWLEMEPKAHISSFDPLSPSVLVQHLKLWQLSIAFLQWFVLFFANMFYHLFVFLTEL